MEPGKLLTALFDPKMVRVLRIFLRDNQKEYYQREISRLARVSPATTFRIISKLKSIEIIKEIRVNRFKLYQVSKNENVKYLESFLKEETQILNNFVKRASQLPGVESIVLHGKELKDRANLLIIGENVDIGEVKAWCGEIREKYKFTISALTLNRDQYDQMSSMGLYSGEKKIVFRKE